MELLFKMYKLLIRLLILFFYFTDENEERSMVEPASLENPKVKELQEVTDSI